MASEGRSIQFGWNVFLFHGLQSSASTIDKIHVTRPPLSFVSFRFLIVPSSQYLVSNQRSGFTYRFQAIGRAETFPAEIRPSCSQNRVFGVRL